jgi:hypothetical protein
MASNRQCLGKITSAKSPLRKFPRFGSGFDGVTGDSEGICIPLQPVVKVRTVEELPSVAKARRFLSSIYGSQG